jgi:hypothetical protein
MLKQAFARLDARLAAENQRRRSEGRPLLPRATFRVLGQTALIEAKLDLELAATMDVDAVAQTFNEILSATGQHWDPHSGEIWMPPETQYSSLFLGQYVEALLARPEYVLISKALKARDKNRNLIIEYLAKSPSELFLGLAQKYQVDLEWFLR